MGYDGKAIIALRVQRGWSQAELARRSGIKQSSLWGIEHEVTKQPKGDTLIGIANALGVPLSAILRRGSKIQPKQEEQLNAIYQGLNPTNKTVLFAAAEALLKAQKKPD
jgi:transcriptional regulator with XRE-family HTH domain